MAKYAFIDGKRIRKVHSVTRIDPIFRDLATGPARIRELRYNKVFPERLAASNILSEDGKKNPVVKIGAEDLVGVELLIDQSTKVVQFYALTSAVKGCGGRIVEAVRIPTRPPAVRFAGKVPRRHVFTRILRRSGSDPRVGDHLVGRGLPRDNGALAQGA
jgi:hypothetical protein